MKFSPDTKIKLRSGKFVPRFVIKSVRDSYRLVQADQGHNMLAVLALGELANYVHLKYWEVAQGYQTYLKGFGLWPLSPDQYEVLRNGLDDRGLFPRWINPIFTEGPTFRAEIGGLPRPALLLPHPQETIRQMHRPGPRRTKKRRR